MTITKILSHPVTIIVITIISLMFFLSLDRSSKKTQFSSENIRLLESEINQISGEVAELEKKIDEAQTEQFKEKIVRNELLLQKPGEYILQIPEHLPIDTQLRCHSQDCLEETKNNAPSPLYSWIKLLI